MNITPLTRKFFEQPTLKVAEDLLGKLFVFNNFKGIIIETEAYIGIDDPACHAARGRTPRTEIMFGNAGHSYVYLIYGMYHCLNFVTEAVGFPAGVLIRSIQIIEPESILLDGPGKLCKHLGITRQHTGLDIINLPNFFVADIERKFEISTTPRIGIKQGVDKLWRFVAHDRVNFSK
ncbi:MAG: DNA-3-methyladenine glycosylase [Candidatus Paracaedibacteraceae bacterium]|nr:DNA-3-methyladenine glycosylase [Candidatus Paracaedibacteraceae bacterium]